MFNSIAANSVSPMNVVALASAASKKTWLSHALFHSDFDQSLRQGKFNAEPGAG
jgi:hypothetical protein